MLEQFDAEKLNLTLLQLSSPILPSFFPLIQKQAEIKNFKKEEQPLKKISGSSSLYSLLHKMILRSPEEKLNEKLTAELVPLGEKVIKLLSEFNCRIFILKPWEKNSDIRINDIAVNIPEALASAGGGILDERRGAYFDKYRLIVIGAEQIGNSYMSIHEAGHAFDHAFTAAHRRPKDLSLLLWNCFHKTRKRFITSYAGTNPREYFAESFTAFFGTDQNLLAECDPEMFNFFQEFFDA